MNEPDVLNHFKKILHDQLPGAGVSIQSLPRANPLKLALIDPAFDDSCLSQDVQNKLMDDPPYWIFCWASGYALAELILKEQIDVSNKVVVDFGAGGGAGAIAAALAGASKVYACDIDPVGNEVLALNALINKVSIEIVDDLAKADGVDLLIAADVLYERANYHFLDLFLTAAPDIVVADSRLKSMPNENYTLVETVNTTSFPDFNEALEFNEVKFYRNT
ncbi:MAG: 50S ribosomal protein L11 methyltransferase [Pseudomonadales bacterium]|nr:50S ribosomal protein L11 methyltransferase [Pseudomonadales bacterium]